MLDYLGRIHPLVIHFPIALLLLAALTELCLVKFKRPGLESAMHALLTGGAFAAILAVITGWVFARGYHRHDTAELLAWHRWLGIATAILAVSAWITTRSANEPFSRRRLLTRRVLLWCGSISLIAAAHIGALLVWGTDYFSP